MNTTRPPPDSLRLERESTMVDFKMRSSPSKSPSRRPLTSSPMSDPSSSPAMTFSPRPPHMDRSPSPCRNPADADEILDIVRHQQKHKNGLTIEREPTMTWREKRKPLLPGIPKSHREGSGDGSYPESNSLKPASHSSLSRSLENIPGPNPRTVEQNRLLKPKMPVARVRSLPPIEVHMERPSAPDPMDRDHHSGGEQWDDRWSDSSSPGGSCERVHEGLINFVFFES